MDTLIREVDMTRSMDIMKRSYNSKEKVDLMEVSESQVVDNSLNKGKSTCLKNQNIMNMYTKCSGKSR